MVENFALNSRNVLLVFTMDSGVIKQSTVDRTAYIFDDPGSTVNCYQQILRHNKEPEKIFQHKVIKLLKVVETIKIKCMKCCQLRPET